MSDRSIKELTAAMSPDTLDILEKDATVLVIAAECALMAARLDSLGMSYDSAPSHSIHVIATELRRVDTSLRAVIRLSGRAG